MGRVSVPFASGALLLKGSDGRVVRASFGESGPSAGSEVALPPGEYALVGYRIYRKDSQGKPWILSASGHSIQKVTVQAGQKSELKIPESVQITSRLRNGQVQMMVHGIGHAGATLYKDGKRIEMGYRVVTPDGRMLRDGKITYG
jgi:hypothetical protein